MLPALPARAAAGGATTAQLLWASMYARAGNASNFAGVARSVGVPGHAARGIGAKIVHSQVLAGQGLASLKLAARPMPMHSKQVAASRPSDPLQEHVQKWLFDEPEEAIETDQSDRSDADTSPHHEDQL